MKILWDRGPSAARDVYAALPGGRTWAYETVKTLLSRLVAKQAVEYDQVGNSYLYRPAVSRDEMTRAELQSVFDRVVGGPLSPVLAHFIEQADLSADEIEELRKTLDQKRRRRPRQRGRGQ